MCTVVARRREAADALQFAEGVATFEGFECFARLSRCGTAACVDCETSWQFYHRASRVRDADEMAGADAALRIISRVWGEDQQDLRQHRRGHQKALDRHRDRKARELLVQGRSARARREVARVFEDAPGLTLVAFVPGGRSKRLFARRRRLPAVRRTPRPAAR